MPVGDSLMITDVSWKNVFNAAVKMVDNRACHYWQNICFNFGVYGNTVQNRKISHKNNTMLGNSHNDNISHVTLDMHMVREANSGSKRNCAIISDGWRSSSKDLHSCFELPWGTSVTNYICCY